jgi:hypothetical protein
MVGAAFFVCRCPKQNKNPAALLPVCSKSGVEATAFFHFSQKKMLFFGKEQLKTIFIRATIETNTEGYRTCDCRKG